MVSTGSRPCRSPRLLGKHVHSRPLEKNKNKRKKLRPATQNQSQPSTSARVNLLSLPDEILCRILLDLGACNTGGTFRGPRHAFALAQTNTRLLRLFGSVLTCIAPDFENEEPATLWPEHLLSVITLAGHSLRELHLPKSSFEDLPTICRTCPRLEVLSVVNDERITTNVLSEALSLPLRSLSITEPSRDHLGLLVFPPPDLSLVNVSVLDVEGLKPMLLDPPKQLNLSISGSHDFFTQSVVNSLMGSLGNAIPKMESVSVNFPLGVGLGRDCFPFEAKELVSEVRQNNDHSTCMSLSLDGAALFGLVTKAHRNAKIELTRWQETFGDAGDGVYPLAISPCDEYLSEMCDFSRLREVRIWDPVGPRWKDILSGVRLKRLRVCDPYSAAEMSLTFETLEMFIPDLKGKNWSWLGDARHVRLTGRTDRFSRKERIVLMEALASLMQQFRGDTVWIKYIDPYHLMREGYDDRFADAVKAVHAGVERLEERGGDAGTLKTLSGEIMTRWRR